MQYTIYRLILENECSLAPWPLALLLELDLQSMRPLVLFLTEIMQNSQFYTEPTLEIRMKDVTELLNVSTNTIESLWVFVIFLHNQNVLQFIVPSFPNWLVSIIVVSQDLSVILSPGSSPNKIAAIFTFSQNFHFYF